MSWNLPSNIMGLYGMQGADDQKGDQQPEQDVFDKGLQALYGGSQMGSNNMMAMMMGGGMGGGGMGMGMGGFGFAKGGAVDAANETVRAHLRNGGGFHPIFNSDREAGIRTILAEARGEGYPGMSGVAHNLFNRANAGFRGNDITSVVTAPHQYSSWNAHGAANQAGKSALKIPEDSPLYKQAAEAYDNAAGGIEPDPTHGASHYRNAAHSSHASNKWASQLQDVNQIGHHTFGREPGFKVPEPKPGPNLGDQQMLSNIDQAKQVSAQMVNRPDPFGVGQGMAMPQSMNIAPPPSAPPLPMHQNMGPPMPMGAPPQAPNAPMPPMRPDHFGPMVNAPQPPMRPEMGPSMGGMSHPNMGPMQQEMAHPFMGPQMTDMAKPFAPPQMEQIKAPGEELNVLNDAPQAANVDIAQAPNMTDGLEHAVDFSGGLGGADDLMGIFDVFRRGGAVRPFDKRPEKGGGGAAAADAVARILRAYHGSPHKFDKFDLSKIGTGQGAQSFGHGLYFAGNEKVAKDYRDTLSDGTLIDSSGRIIRPMDDLLHTNVAITTDRKGVDAGLARAQALINSQTPNGAAPTLDQLMSMSFNKPHRSWDALMSDYEKLQNWKAQGVTKNPGYMYEVDLNTDPNRMMDWYAPMSQQPENVRGALMDRAAKAADEANEARAFMLNRGTDTFGKPFKPERLEQLNKVADPENFTGNALYNLTMRDHGAISPGEKMPEASQALFDMGIPGIKYRDQGSFGLPPDQQTSNYVMFDDKPIEILRRYAQGGRAGFATDGGVDGDVQYAPEFHRDETLMDRPSIPVHMYSDKMADAISHDAPVWQPPKDTSGAQAPDDRAHEVVNRMLHPQQSVPMIVGQDMWDKAKQYNEDNRIVPSQDAHSFVQQALNKGEKQLPQYDPTTEENIAAGAKTAGHMGMYAVPYLGEAMAGYDAAQAAKYLASGDAKKAWDEGNYGELGGYVADAAGMTLGLKGKALQRALQMGGLGGVGSIMAPEDAEAGVFSHMSDDAYRAIRAMMENSGKGSDLLVTHSGDARQLADTLLRTDGALTAPSLALSKMGGVPLDFGGVTLVGRPHLAVPSGDNMVFSGDAFTPRVPYPRMSPTGTPGEFRSWMPRTRELERAKVVPPEDQVAPTPENILNYIKSGPILGGEGSGEGIHDAHTLMVQANGPFKTFEDVKKFGKDLPWDEHENKDAWSDYYSELDGIGGLLQRYYRPPPHLDLTKRDIGNFRNNFSTAVADYIKNGQDWDAFLQHYPDAPPITQPRVRDFISTLQNMRPSYMEAKALRQVGMDEFAGAVIPTGQSQERLMELLQHYGIDKNNIHLYQRDNDQQRLHRLLNFKDQLFADGGEVGGAEVSEQKAINSADRDAMARAVELATAPADRAQSFSPSPMQERITPDMYNNFMARSTAQFIKGNDGRAILNNDDPDSSMDIVRSYQHPRNYNEEIDKLRQIGTASVTDPEGRTGNPAFVAGTAPDGTEIPMNQAQQAMMAHAVAKLTYNYDDAHPEVRGATVAANGPYFEDKLPKGQTGQIITVNQAPFTGGGAPTSTLGHETGHAFGRVMDVPLNHELEGAGDKVLADLRRMNAERVGLTEQQLYEKHPFARKAVNQKGMDDAQQYYTSPSESWADAFGRYVTHPNDFKTKYPDAAKYLRDKVNTNPELNRLLMLSQDEGRQYSAEGGRVEKGGGGSMKQAAEIIKRLGKLMPEGSGFRGIPNQPPIVNLPGIGRVEARPIPDLMSAKNRILMEQGKSTGDQAIVPVQPLFSARVAKAFDQMAHDPQDPLVKRSYDAMIEETMNQYRKAKEAGYDFHFMRDGEADPYAVSPALGYADLVNNRRMTVFPTDQGFGTQVDISDNPLLKRVGPVGDLPDATANDAFRIVHDVYGHHGPGNAFFRGPGEERAFQYHGKMYSDAALPAAASETRGQNSWVNYGPHAEQNATASGADTIYADQKSGLLPYWATQLPPREGMSDSDIDDYVRTLMRRASGGRAGEAEDTTAHDFDRQMLDSGEPQIPQHNDRFERGMNDLFGMPQAEAGTAKEAAEYVARQLARYGKQTVDNPQRNAFPMIYSNPRDLAEEAASRVAPESTALKQLFGVTRQDLYDMSAGRVGNAEPELVMKKNPRGSEATKNVQTKRNELRLMDILAEGGTHEGLRVGMDAWYTMDPLFQQMERLYGKEEAIKHFNLLNHATGTMSPGSPVTTEMNRGLAAYYLARNGRLNDFIQYGGKPGKHTGAIPGKNMSFSEEFPDLLGHAYHSTSQAPILGKYVETGEHGMQSPKVPLYIQSSGVPETGHQTSLPVADAHFTRGIGLADTRGGSDKGAGASMKMSEFQQLGPWWRDKVASKVGLESVPAQARLWGTLSKATGVDTAIGAPKLELMANEIMRIAHKYRISPEMARDMVLRGELFNQGGAVNDNVTTATDRARSLASAK